MSQPTKALRILSKDLGSLVPCTGAQLDTLLGTISALVGDLTWYHADVETNDRNDEWPRERSPLPVQVALAELRRKASSTDQFLSGVFIGVLASITARGEWWTEDEPFRSLQGASIEIRAFDTSYFEIYALSPEVLDGIAASFGGALVTK